MRIRPEKIIVTSNYHPSQCFTNREDMAPILRRFRLVEDLADLPPIPDQVPLGVQEPLAPELVPLELFQPWEEEQIVPEGVALEIQEAAPGEVREAPEGGEEAPEGGEEAPEGGEEAPGEGRGGSDVVGVSEVRGVREMRVVGEAREGREVREEPSRKKMTLELDVSQEEEAQVSREEEEDEAGLMDERCNQQ